MSSSNLQEMLSGLCEKVQHARGAVITDRDGVSLASSSQLELPSNLFTTFSAAIDQAGKLDLGSGEVIVATLKKEVVVQAVCGSLIITLVGNAGLNIGRAKDVLEHAKADLAAVASAISSEPSLQ
uniref:Roadblock/LAMTOR2 domain-containing protein n=1 Tax=Palpitomonas bilix TaxID=652834 RepID=A0A7S3GHW0_9EUKA|mmetsp:Transcript_50231/g.129311  ORF Transcript_50231/g.129311 Transcript_50231/m.129311 type:complete len:125 (+) Transcript_50231:168-542(+)